MGPDAFNASRNHVSPAAVDRALGQSSSITTWLPAFIEFGCVETEDLPTTGAIRYTITETGPAALSDPAPP